MPWVRVVYRMLGTMGVDAVGDVVYPIAMLHSFKDVIDKFDGPAEFARAVGMTAGAAKQARRRNSISADWFAATARAAKERGLPIDEAELSRIAEARRA